MASTLQTLDYMRLLPDEATATLSRMELLARAKKQGSKSGRHVSPNKGFSVVFAEHRPYTPGDDIKNLVTANDNELVPADKSSSLAAEKGLQNAIWFWPVEQLVNVLVQLYQARYQRNPK